MSSFSAAFATSAETSTSLAQKSAWVDKPLRNVIKVGPVCKSDDLLSHNRLRLDRKRAQFSINSTLATTGSNSPPSSPRGSVYKATIPEVTSTPVFNNQDDPQSLTPDLNLSEIERLVAQATHAAQAAQLEINDKLSDEDYSRLQKARAEERQKKLGAKTRKQKKDLADAIASSSDRTSTSEADTTDALKKPKKKPRRRAKVVLNTSLKTANSTANSKSSVKGVSLGATAAANRKKKIKGLGRPSGDNVRIYLKEIGGKNLLTPDEEVELSRLIQDLLELEKTAALLEGELGRFPSEPQWAAAMGMPLEPFLERLHRARNAKHKMVNCNLRLVVSIAKNYLNRGMSFQDLIQEGSMGLIRGAEKFDHRRGYKFSTYAHWWIRQAITRAIADQSRTIRLPVHMFEILSRVKKTQKAMALDLGRDPTTEELAEELSMTPAKVTAIEKSARLPVSIDMPVGADDEKRRLEDTIEDGVMQSPEEVTTQVLLKEDLENVLNTLNPRERDVLRLRYGLDDGKVRTLEEIGNVFSVTRERIRQIEAKALRKLRQPSRNSVLSDYLHQLPEEDDDMF